MVVETDGICPMSHNINTIIKIVYNIIYPFAIPTIVAIPSAPSTVLSAKIP